MSATIRVATAADTGILLDACLEAYNWNGDARHTRAEISESKYVAGWPEPSDFGVVAHDEAGTALGAAWGRLFAADDAGYGFVDEQTPELTIGVAPSARGVGVGSRLLEALIDLAAESGFTALSLSVEDGNAARRLYERHGFAQVGRSGGSDTLLLKILAVPRR
jgi:ribosomal protein S18 acetylase RimI-like enzyme